MKDFDFIEMGFKIDNKIWDVIDQSWKRIIDIRENIDYKIELEDGLSCSKNGKHYNEDYLPRFYPNKFTLKIPDEAYQKPLPNFKINQPLIVWNNPNEKYRRHFSHFNKYGVCFCFHLGATFFTNSQHVVIYDNYRLPTKAELGDFPGDWEYEGKEK